ncbi:MAG TPA: hypothetical protein VJ933_09890 [Phaeodactylibacter sp.]|nr:hypothetical protein [Phaeodactylibacter sp.]
MKSIFYLLPLLSLLLFSSCGPTLSPFTKRVYEQGNFSTSDLERIQFYLSDDIVLRRELTGGRSEVISGEIKIIDGRKVEQVVIPKGTPGVLAFQSDGGRLAVSFEDGEDRYLMFGPNPTVDGRYTLLASAQKKRFSVVTYEGKKWRVQRNDAYTNLMVDLKKINKVAVQSRTAKGRRVD